MIFGRNCYNNYDQRLRILFKYCDFLSWTFISPILRIIMISREPPLYNITKQAHTHFFNYMLCEIKYTYNVRVYLQYFH